MRIEVIGDDSINRQARIYAEYRLFAALSQVVDTRRVRRASLVLRRAKSNRHRDGVLCTITIELKGGELSRLRASGDHPYAAINRAVERLPLRSWHARQDSSLPEQDSSPPEMATAQDRRGPPGTRSTSTWAHPDPSGHDSRRTIQVRDAPGRSSA